MTVNALTRNSGWAQVMTTLVRRATLNTTQSCDEGLDVILNRAREVSDVSQRTSLYRQAIDKFAFARRNVIYLYHLNYIVSYPKNIKGYKAVPDGLIRIKGVSWQ